MELKFELRSKTPAPGDTVNLKFLPVEVEGGLTGDLTLDGVPEAEAAKFSVPTADERLGVVRNGNGDVTEGQAKQPYQVVTVTVNPA